MKLKLWVPIDHHSIENAPFSSCSGLCRHVHRDAQTSLSSATSSSSQRQSTEMFPSRSWGRPRTPVCPRFTPGHTGSGSLRRHPGNILVRCPKHLSWLPLTDQHLRNDQVPNYINKLSPATLQRKLVPAACVHYLFLWVITQSSFKSKQEFQSFVQVFPD